MESYLCMNSRVMEFRMFLSSPGSVCGTAVAEVELALAGDHTHNLLRLKIVSHNLDHCED